jgi:hypothetical protein
MRRLEQFARDGKVNTRSGSHLRRWLSALSGTHADLALQLVVDSRFAATVENVMLCVNLTTNSGELNRRKEIAVAPQLFSLALKR